jgi:protein TonB
MREPRKKRNSSKTNLTISFIFHSLLIGTLIFFAAREGVFGKKLKQITVTMVPKAKPPEPPKEKPPEPKPQSPKTAEPPKMAVAPPKVEQQAAPPPPDSGIPAPAAPPPVSLPSFSFSDGAKEVQTLSSPSDIYKAVVEHALLAHWNRPEDIADENFVAEVEVTLDSAGKILGYRWLSGSGNERWDNSVKAVLSQFKSINRPPPKGFPEKFTVRFDVESLKTESLLSVQ